MATEEFGWEELPGEGAFYAPKLEFHLNDAIGRTWQVGTLQSDRCCRSGSTPAMSARTAQKHRPVMFHRAIFGTFERFIGILIEHHAGRFPLWLAPVQAVVATIVSDADDYAQRGRGEAAPRRASASRPTCATRRSTTRCASISLAKVPLLLVVGKREAEEGTVALRRLGSDEHQKMMTLDEAVAMIRARRCRRTCAPTEPDATPPQVAAKMTHNCSRVHFSSSAASA